MPSFCSYSNNQVNLINPKIIPSNLERTPVNAQRRLDFDSFDYNCKDLSIGQEIAENHLDSAIMLSAHFDQILSPVERVELTARSNQVTKAVGS